jgi:hypothetical protein
VKRTSTSGPRERLQSFVLDARSSMICTRGKGGIVDHRGIKGNLTMIHKRYRKKNAKNADAKAEKNANIVKSPLDQ